MPSPSINILIRRSRHRLSDFPGYASEYDAKYGVLNTVGPDALATDSQAVRRWLDRSGNGRHLDQPTALNQPTFSATGGPGGRPGILADGVNSQLTNVGGFPSLLTSTIYLVGKPVSWASGDYIYDARSSGVTNGVMMWQRSSTPRISINTTTSDNTTPSWAVGVDAIVTARTPASAGSCFIRVNDNAEEGFTMPASLEADSSLHLFGRPTLGFANMLLYALVIYTANHDAATQAMVRGILKREWGLV